MLVDDMIICTGWGLAGLECCYFCYCFYSSSRYAAWGCSRIYRLHSPSYSYPCSIIFQAEVVCYGDTLYREITIEEGLQLLLRKVEVVVMCLSSNWEDRQLVPAFPFFWQPPSGDACSCWCYPSVGMYHTHISTENIASGDSQGNFRSWEWVFVNIAPHSFEAFFLVRVLEGNLHHISYMRSHSFGLLLDLVLEVKRWDNRME